MFKDLESKDKCFDKKYLFINENLVYIRQLSMQVKDLVNTAIVSDLPQGANLEEIV